MSTPARRRAMTPWRIQLLNLAANGHTNAQIGARFDRTANAINCDMQVIYRALGANSRTHAVALGIRYGYIAARSIQPRPTRDERGAA